MPIHRTASQLTEVRTLLRQVVPNKNFAVFGSRTREFVKPHADLDILCEDSLAPLERARLEIAFEESDLPFRVDILARDDLGQIAKKPTDLVPIT